tara:strand:- start:891 stop:1271 length:381 start_codon:yes stop_codon:yes gene_type:complete
MKWIVIAALAILTACTAPQEAVTPIVIKNEPIDRPRLIVPSVDRFAAMPVKWTIVTPSNVEQVFADMQAKGTPLALFVVTARGYENIAINTQGALSVIVQQQAVIDGYQVYYIQTDKTISKFNTNQ